MTSITVLLVAPSSTSARAPSVPAYRYEIRLTRTEVDTHAAFVRITHRGKSRLLLVRKEATNWRGGYVFPRGRKAYVVAQYDRGVYLWECEGKSVRVSSHSCPTDSSIVAAGPFGALVESESHYRRGGRTYERTVYSLWDARSLRWRHLGGRLPPVELQ